MKQEIGLAFEAVEFGPARFIGRKVTVEAGKTARKLWKAYLSDGSNEELQALPGRVSPPGDCADWMGEYDAQTKTFTELVGLFAAPGSAVPEGYDFRDIPACLLGKCWITGGTPNLERGAHNKAVKIMQKEGYEPDYGPGFSMEYYSYEKYAAVQSGTGAVYTFGYFLPCRRREG